jgi:hypothetical protein
LVHTYYQVDRREQIIEFLNSKIKSAEEDPDKKSITTWNDYLGDIKYFFRWLYNKKKTEKGSGKKKKLYALIGKHLLLPELRKRKQKG